MWHVALNFIYYTVSYASLSIVCVPFGCMCELLGGVVAHPSSYKAPRHCKRSEAGCEIQLIVIIGSMPLRTLPACQGGSLTLHICIVSSYQHSPRQRTDHTAD